MSKRALTAAACAALVIGIVPIVNASDDRGGYGGNDDRDCNEGGNYRGSSGGHGDNRGGYGGDLSVIGLTADQRLICFEEDDPDEAEDVGRITGLTGDQRLVGIDYRPATGDLYGLGNNGGVYVVNDETGRATLRSRLNVPLQGQSFGVDFNPAVDRLRIVSDTGQNLRDNVDVNGDTITDAPLTYPPATTPATGISGAAYTNNDADPNTATTLYDIDASMDQVAIQSPANAGTLAATGKLGVDTNTQVGSDIYSTIRNGTTVDVQGFASLTVGSRTGFYEITLFTGKASSQGTFSSRNKVIGIAIPLNQL